MNWNKIEDAPRDGRPLLLKTEAYLGGLAKEHPMRYWVGALLLSGNYWHPKMHSKKLDHDISSEITEDMKPTHFCEIRD